MALEDRARGQRIAQLRKSKHLTQEAAAQRLGVGYRTYQTWEAGRLPEWANVEKLAKFHGIKPEDLVGSDGLAGSEVAIPQLDRIEAKLDELLNRLPSSGLAEVLEAEARRLAEQRARNAAASKRKPPRRKAS